MSLLEDVQNILNSATAVLPPSMTGNTNPGIGGGIASLVANMVASGAIPKPQPPTTTPSMGSIGTMVANAIAKSNSSKQPRTSYVNIPSNAGQNYTNSPAYRPPAQVSAAPSTAKQPVMNYVNIPAPAGQDYSNSPAIKPPTPVGGPLPPTPTKPTTSAPQQQIWEVGPGEWYTNEADYRAALARRNAQNNSNSPTPTTGTGTNTGSRNSGPYNPINDPSYQFRLKQGMDVLQAGAAARGMLNSGRTLKELLRYGQDYASQEYMNEYTRRLNLSQLGLQAAMSQLGGANVPIPNVSSPQTPGASNFNTNPINTGALGAYGNAISGAAGNYAQSGYYTGLGQAGAANAWGNALSGIGNIAGQYFGGGNYSGPAGTNPTSWQPFYSGPAW